MFYYIYKITNWYNGKIYVGMHSTKDLDDNYFGSGKHLKNAIKKYGIEYFTKEILQQFNSIEEMAHAEEILVNEEFVKDPMTYNGAIGGIHGSWYFKLTKDQLKLGGINAQKSIKEKCINNPLYLEEYKKILKNASIKRNEIIKQKRLLDSEYDKIYRKRCSNAFKGKHHTEETKRKISEASSKANSGENNPMAKRCWIYNLELKESKLILKDELDQYINNGWLNGKLPNLEKIELKKKEIEKRKEIIKNERKEYSLLIKNLYKELKTIRAVANYLNISHVTVLNFLKL